MLGRVLGRVRRVRWAGAGRVGSRRGKAVERGGRGVLPRVRRRAVGAVYRRGKPVNARARAVVGGDGVPGVVAGQQVEVGGVSALRRVLGSSRAARAGSRGSGQGAGSWFTGGVDRWGAGVGEGVIAGCCHCIVLSGCGVRGPEGGERRQWAGPGPGALGYGPGAPGGGEVRRPRWGGERGGPGGGGMKGERLQGGGSGGCWWVLGSSRAGLMNQQTQGAGGKRGERGSRREWVAEGWGGAGEPRCAGEAGSPPLMLGRGGAG